MMFMWMTLLGALLVERKNKHVKFSLIYDALPPVAGEIFHIIGFLIILVVLAASFVPTVKYIRFMKIQTTPVLHIPLNRAYSVYILFLVAMCGYQIANIVQAVRNIVHHKTMLKKSRLKFEEVGEIQE